MPNISKGRLETIDIEIPPLVLQSAFAARCEAIQRLKEVHFASLAQLDSIFDSLQERAFRGRL
jgi:type I restriction enzyme S subunit